jgi:hypothetical protein
VRYFFDNDISPALAHMLKALGIDAAHLRDIYPANTKDVVFLADLKTAGFDVFISNNSDQRRIPQESALVKASGVTCLYFNPCLEQDDDLASSRLAFEELAENRRFLPGNRERHYGRFTGQRNRSAFQDLARIHDSIPGAR